MKILLTSLITLLILGCHHFADYKLNESNGTRKIYYSDSGTFKIIIEPSQQLPLVKTTGKLLEIKGNLLKVELTTLAPKWPPKKRIVYFEVNHEGQDFKEVKGKP